MLEFEIIENSDRQTIALKGAVKDGAEQVFSTLLEVDTLANELEISISGLQSMSSIGAAAWVKFIDGLSERCSKIVVKDCPIFFVDYLNMFDAFRSGVQILSVEIPYSCPTCGYQMSKFVMLDQDNLDREFGTIDCPECSGVMDCLVAQDDYLAFMS